MKQLRSFVFNSHMAVEEIFAALVKMDSSVQWRRGDSEYYGSHVDGLTADGNDLRIFAGEWAGRSEGYVIELLSGADSASQEALLNGIIIALDAKDWREVRIDE